MGCRALYRCVLGHMHVQTYVLVARQHIHHNACHNVIVATHTIMCTTPIRTSSHPQHSHTLTQRLPLSVQQLVQQSPSLTQSNGLLLGRRATSVFVVDAASGRVIKSYWDHTPDGNVHGDVLSGMDDAHDGDASPGV